MNKKLILALLFICVFIYFSIGLNNEQPAEDLEVVTGFGVDMDKEETNKILYVAPSNIYVFEEGEKTSGGIRTGIGEDPAETRENRQLTSNKQFILGLEKIYLLSEAVAQKGFSLPMEIFFRNASTNDSALVVVSRKKPEEIFELQIKGSPTSSDYIEGLLKNARNYNFFPSNYKLSDVFLNLDTEGKNLVLPLIDEVNNQIAIVGVCVFKNGKMIGTLNLKDTKNLNILSGTDGKGLISFIISPTKYLDFYGTVERKVKVYKLKENYKYIIELKFNGDIISDTIYIDYMNKASTNSKMEQELGNVIKLQSERFIDKFRKQFGVDSLQLGQYAAAKYGRENGVNWDKVFSDAEIEVQVKVNIDRTGRGGYSIIKNPQ